jgi:hypothetical protein
MRASGDIACWELGPPSEFAAASCTATDSVSFSRRQGSVHLDRFSWLSPGLFSTWWPVPSVASCNRAAVASLQRIADQAASRTAPSPRVFGWPPHRPRLKGRSLLQRSGHLASRRRYRGVLAFSSCSRSAWSVQASASSRARAGCFQGLWPVPPWRADSERCGPKVAAPSEQRQSASEQVALTPASQRHCAPCLTQRCCRRGLRLRSGLAAERLAVRRAHQRASDYHKAACGCAGHGQ